MAADDYLGISNQTQKSLEKKADEIYQNFDVTVLRELSSRKQLKSVYFKIILISGRKLFVFKKSFQNILKDL